MIENNKKCPKMGLARSLRNVLFCLCILANSIILIISKREIEIYEELWVISAGAFFFLAVSLGPCFVIEKIPNKIRILNFNEPKISCQKFRLFSAKFCTKIINKIGLSLP